MICWITVMLLKLPAEKLSRIRRRRPRWCHLLRDMNIALRRHVGDEIIREEAGRSHTSSSNILRDSRLARGRQEQNRRLGITQTGTCAQCNKILAICIRRSSESDFRRRVADHPRRTPLAPHEKSLYPQPILPVPHQMPSDPPLKGLKVVELGGLAPVPFVGYLSIPHPARLTLLKAPLSRFWSGCSPHRSPKRILRSPRQSQPS
jgi:hypothetical protein